MWVVTSCQSECSIVVWETLATVVYNTVPGSHTCQLQRTPSLSVSMAMSKCSDPLRLPNAGCVVATRNTWIKLWMVYLRLWLDTAPNFGHIAVQQWTLNLAINRHFDRVVLPPTFHTHGHWGYPGPPFDGWGEDEVATVDGEVILFAHKAW